MKIAVIAWGSLVWNPRDLQIVGEWKKDGPLLPVEFARISQDGRVTLVLLEDAEPQRTYWAMSALQDIEKAIVNLTKREGTTTPNIHGLDANRKTYGKPEESVVKAVTAWLNDHAHEVDGAVWTGLASNWQSKRQRRFSPEDVVRYLERIHGETRQRAKEYFQKAPLQIRTKARQLVEERLGWKPETDQT